MTADDRDSGPQSLRDLTRHSGEIIILDKIAARQGPQTLDDLTRVTAYQAWRMFTEGRNKWGARLFHKICIIMAREQLRFSDTDPAAFLGINPKALKPWVDWCKTEGLSEQLAEKLARDGVIDPEILLSITDTDLSTNLTRRITRAEVAQLRKLLGLTPPT